MKSSSLSTIESSTIHGLLNEIINECIILEKKSGRKSNNPTRFASFLVIAGDFTVTQVDQVISFMIEPIKEKSITTKKIQNMKDRLNAVSNHGGLRKKVSTLLMKQSSYSPVDIAHLKEWITLCEAYTKNSELVQFAEEVLGGSLKIESEKLEYLTNLIRQKINNNEEEVIVMSTSTNKEIHIITQENLLDLLLEKTPEDYRESLSLQDIYNYFPDLIILKDHVEVLPFQYDDGEYEVDLLVSLMNTPCENGFEFTVGITDWDEDLDHYRTAFQKVPMKALAKFFEDLFQEKSIDYIDYTVLGKLQNILIQTI